MPKMVPLLSLPTMTKPLATPGKGWSTTWVLKVSHFPWMSAMSTTLFATRLWMIDELAEPTIMALVKVDETVEFDTVRFMTALAFPVICPRSVARLRAAMCTPV
jgi:hypothetical protein